MGGQVGFLEARDTQDQGRVSVRPMSMASEPDQAKENAEGDEEEEERESEEEEEEGRTPKGVRAPTGPTKAEREEHERCHIPYRSWCRYCVRGRGRNKPHKKAQGEEEAEGVQKGRVSMDYFFLTKKDQAEGKNPILVMVDDESGNVFARAVEQKGVGENREMEWLLNSMVEELDEWGYRGQDLIMKNDQEPSIEAVRKAVTALRVGKTIPEGSARGESQSNGRAEDAGRRVREYARVLKEQMEDKMQGVIDAEDPIMQWLVRWAAMMMNRCSVGQDGKTPFERVRGRRCKTEVIRFGEKVWYKKLKPTGLGSMDSAWDEGIWMGHNNKSNEVVIGTAEGVVAAYAIKRMEAGKQWDAEAIKGVTGTPGYPVGGGPMGRIPIRVNFEPAAQEEPEATIPRRREEAPRRTYVKPSKYGYTEGCEGCRRAQAGRGAVGPRTHSEACRKRVQEEMEKDERGKERLTRKKRKDDEFLEEHAKKQEEAEEEAAKKRARKEEPPRGEKREGEKQSEEEPPEKATRTDEDKGVSSSSSSGLEDVVLEVLREKLFGVDVAEIYSPDRISAEAKKFGLKAGWSMDLLTGWDFGSKADRVAAAAYQEREKPELLVGSPMCRMFSALQTMSGWSRHKQRQWDTDVKHLEWAMERYEKQMEMGKLFLHEHPASASSWRLRKVRKLANTPGVFEVVGDMCQFGLRTTGGGFARKRSRFLTNSWEIAQEISKLCPGTHVHTPLVGGKAKATEQYTPEFCRAVCRGLLKEKRHRVMHLCQVAEIKAMTKGEKGRDVEDGHDREEARRSLEALNGMCEWEAWDDVSGMKLDIEQVKKARYDEITWVRQKGVYRKIPRAEALERGLKVIRVRWIDINKGDDDRPVYRSRLVAMEFKNTDKSMEDLFAGTPPLEALRMLVSEAATVEGGTAGDKVLLLADVSRAFFEADARREICVEIPAEDKRENQQEEEEEDLVGYLMKSLYGTRDAAANWQEEVAKAMRGWGFRRGVSNPCVYWHREQGLKALVHGDDFGAVGNRAGIKWFKGKLGERFGIKTTTVGMGPEEEREGRMLNRIVAVSKEGWSYEADQRHAELIVQGLGLSEAKGIGVPGEDEREEDEGLEEDCSAAEATRFRALAARCNYLGVDRTEIQYAVKEICRGMSTPKKKHWDKLKKLGRYLISQPRMVQEYRWQGRLDKMTVYSDSDWAGCKSTGRSTSGGMIMMGGHMIKSWARTQKVVALSSAEAELVAMVKATAEGLGISSLAADWGMRLGAEVLADSSAALGIVKRKGLGKLRHVKVGMLWVQDIREQEGVEFKKVKGELNPADMCTKYLNKGKLEGHREGVNLRARDGRAGKASQLQKGS